jgi:hypothetical protein
VSGPATWSRGRIAARSELRLLLVGLLGAALLAGCGGGATSAPGASGAVPTGATETSAPTSAAAETPATGGTDSVDACALITTVEVAAIVGKPVTIEKAAADQDWAAGECWWNSETMDVRFSVDVGTPASIAKSSSPTTQEQLDLFKIASMAPNPVDISGVGDAAAFGNLMLVAIKGGSMVEVFGLAQDKATAIAKLVLANMP